MQVKILKYHLAIISPVDDYRKGFKNNFFMFLRPPAYALIFWIYIYLRPCKTRILEHLQGAAKKVCERVLSTRLDRGHSCSLVKLLLRKVVCGQRYYKGLLVFFLQYTIAMLLPLKVISTLKSSTLPIYVNADIFLQFPYIEFTFTLSRTVWYHPSYWCSVWRSCFDAFLKDSGFKIEKLARFSFFDGMKWYRSKMFLWKWKIWVFWSFLLFFMKLISIKIWCRPLYHGISYHGIRDDTKFWWK